jgi:hypothetical protein
VGYLYSGGPSVFWWDAYSLPLFFMWAVYWNSWLYFSIVCPHFAQHTSKCLFYWVTMSTLDNMTCHRSFNVLLPSRHIIQLMWRDGSNNRVCW